MSFAAETKKELTLVAESACCRRAELLAVLDLNAELVESGSLTSMVVETENVATARRIYTQVKNQFAIHPEVVVRKKMRLKKNNVYAIRFSLAQARQVADALEFQLPNSRGQIKSKFPRKWKSCCKRAYLRGAFLASGSVNSPGSQSYHLEINASSKMVAEEVQALMNEFGLHAKQINRKKGFVVYLKEGEKIVEFLSLIGAHQALLKFEDKRILKGMRNQVNRLVNCETANMNKAIAAAVRQLDVIQYLDGRIGLEKLPNHLREVAELRLRYPEINLQELSAKLSHTVSKSGLNHRFKKLEQMAERLKTGQSI
jgi:cell division protein WhiA